MTTGVIYARVSSIGDRQSTERQVKDLSEYAKYKLFLLYVEVDATVNEFLNRGKNLKRITPQSWQFTDK